MKIFKDRVVAGKILSRHLEEYKGMDNTIVLGIPRGGVVVAAKIAKELNLPLDIIVTRKIGAPNQPELALCAVDSDGDMVWDEGNVREIGEVGEIREIVQKEKEEIKRREQLYRQGAELLNVENKVVILVDDGIATGATILAAINYLKRHKAKKIILAVPVASRESVERVIREIGPLRPRSGARDIGEIVVLESPDYFSAVGQFYQEFLPVSDEEVIQLLKHE